MLPASECSNLGTASHPGGQWLLDLRSDKTASFSVDGIMWCDNLIISGDANGLGFWASPGTMLVVSGLSVTSASVETVTDLEITAASDGGNAKAVLRDSGDNDSWICLKDKTGWLVFTAKRDLVLTRVSLKNTHHGNAADRGTKDFAIDFSDDAERWNLAFEGQLEAASPGAKAALQGFDLESIGGVRFVRFRALSFYGDGAGLSFIEFEDRQMR